MLTKKGVQLTASSYSMTGRSCSRLKLICTFETKYFILVAPKYFNLIALCGKFNMPILYKNFHGSIAAGCEKHKDNSWENYKVYFHIGTVKFTQVT